MFKKAKPLKDPTDSAHGFEYAMFLLGLRLRTDGEIRDKMRQRGYEKSVIDKVLTQLVDLKYVDDNRFVGSLIESYKQHRTYGYFKIRQKLLEKKLTSEFVNQSMDELFSVEDELEVAKRLLNKEFSEFMTNTEAVSYQEKQKIGQKLQARGFRMDVIAKLVFNR
jgi:regulatory protein